MEKNTRPPLYWKTWRVAGPGIAVGCAALIADSHLVWALGLLVLALLVFFVPWFLAPYSKTARSITRPSNEAFKRFERLADWLGSLPVFGVVWRGAERVTGNVGRTEAEAHRRWLREQDDDASNA